MSDLPPPFEPDETSLEPHARNEAFAPDSACAQRVFPSPNFGERRGAVAPDSIILHYTGMGTPAAALLWLANALSQVSCHYFVFEDGRIFQMVPESARAWHAGKSSWHGEEDMNSRSIGIEIANTGHDLATLTPEAGPQSGRARNPLPPVGPAFPPAQIKAVSALVKDIAARWRIPGARILAHSDIAPGRKLDPGERFPWARLAQDGVGLWVEPPAAPGVASYRLGDEGMPIAALQSMFARFGYGLAITGVFDMPTEDVVIAFQRHWRQSKVDGVADGQTLATLKALMNRETLA